MRYLTVALVLFSGSAVACGIPVSELSLGGIGTGDSEASVFEKLGVPAERVDTGEGIELRYPGLIVSVGWLEQAAPGVERRVFAMRADGRSICTPMGLCPGMEAAHAFKLYGPVEATARETGTFLEYQPVAAHCWLQIHAPESTIASLAVACQP
jgi:hypothetical protein